MSNILQPNLVSVDRIIVHQFDIATPSPGGIDTCLRGISKYSRQSLAFVGVDAGSGPPDRQLGRWENYGDKTRDIWFLPVSRLDPGNQSRRIPHSLRLVAGLMRHWQKLPKTRAIQAHRMDTALLASGLSRKPLVYMVHTQRGGLTGRTSDSFWRFAGKLHERLERHVVQIAKDVVVFNPEYARTVQEWNGKARFSPTWWDPALISKPRTRRPNSICWVGRLEVPKDPELAVSVAEALYEIAPQYEWTLDILGSGTLLTDLRSRVANLPAGLRSNIRVRGRVEPAAVADYMAQSQTFLMTSHPGYEGYPRVLVEALASGLPAVVTEGSDTGGIVDDNVNGFVTNRDPYTIAQKILDARGLSSADAEKTVLHLSAPVVVGRVMSDDSSAT